MKRLLSIFLCLFFLTQIISAQSNVEPPKEVGVFLEIIDEVEIGTSSVTTDSLNVKFNGYFIPPTNLDSVLSYHVVFEVNDNQEILNFTLGLDGTGFPNGVEVFEEEGVWYIYTGSYSGVSEYKMKCSVHYMNGIESSPLIFNSGN